MVRAFLFGGRDGASLPLEDESGIERATRRGEGVLWVDLQAPEEDEFQMLSRVFHFHPLSIEDCRAYSEFPKVDEFSDYLFVVTHYVECAADETCDRLSIGELDIFVGQAFVVTVHTRPAAIVDRCIERFREHPETPAMGPDFLVHALLDELVDAFVPLLDRWDDLLEDTEEALLMGRTGDVLQRLTAIRRSILRARKSFTPTREVVGRLARRDVAFISEQAAWYFRDVSDHALRIHGMLDSARDAVANLFELYMSMSSHRANLVMKRLTIVATVFLPLTFIAGVYGMNFRYMPELEWRYGYLMAWIVMLLVGGGFLVYFRRRGWF
ncbi:MAG: magnesium/cobalt transporter CorA [Firmicutes bacterium]|jgi:magnesium transporter|nr:magnesium/cobalt transporter CorA [Bacillota bacterium]MDH7496498.1 magnesium/cobalt transporter CorA [Bacillota bacterium]